MDLARIQQIISAKANKGPREGLLKDGRTIFNSKKEKIGTQYDVFSGPLGARVQVLDANPNEFKVLYQGKSQIMSGDQMNEFFTAQGMADNTPLLELMRKAAISKAQQEDVKKMNNGKN